MILPLLLPLLGSALGPSLLGSLGIHGALASALGSGIASYALTGDPKEALKSGLFGFGIGKLGQLAQAGSHASTAVSQAQRVAAAQKAAAEAAAKAATKGASEAAITAATRATGPAMGGLKNIMPNAVVGRTASTAAELSPMRAIMADPRASLQLALHNPLTTIAPMAAGLLLRGPKAEAAPARAKEKSDRPPGGYQPTPRSIMPFQGDYSHYGESGPEHAWFGPAPSSAPSAMDAGYDVGGLWPNRFGEEFMARGGGVVGPGGPTADRVPAQLSNGEYVLNAKTVKKIGGGSTQKGFERLDAVNHPNRPKKKRAKKMKDGGPVYEPVLGEPADAPDARTPRDFDADLRQLLAYARKNNSLRAPYVGPTGPWDDQKGLVLNDGIMRSTPQRRGSIGAGTAIRPYALDVEDIRRKQRAKRAKQPDPSKDYSATDLLMYQLFGIAPQPR